MKILSINQAKIYRFLILLIFIFCFSSTFGQTKIGEKNKNEVVTLKINPIGNAEAKNYSKGEIFKNGTTFETSDTPVILGANGNRQELQANTRHRIIFKGIKETHITYKGKVRHEVNNNETGYKFSLKDGIKVTSINTIFEIEVTKKRVIVTSVEGKVHTFQKVPIKLTTTNGENKTKNKLEATNFKSAQDGQILTFDRYPDSEESFTNEEALIFFIKELKSHEGFDAPDEQLADDNNLIGELHLDLNQPSRAIPYFNKALVYYRNTEFSYQELADVHLNLTEAYDDLDEYDNVESYGELAIQYLEDENILNEEDLIYAKEDGDDELISEIKEDLYFNYWNMSWIYEITNRPILAEEYLDLANKYK